MKRWILPLLVALVAIVFIARAVQPAEPTYADYQRAQLAADQAQALAPVWMIAQALLILGIPLLILGAGGVALWRFRRLARPDAAGRLPAVLDPQYAALAAAALQQYHVGEQTRAVHQAGQVPHSITYSPNLSRAITTRIPEQLADYALPSLEAAIVPSFAQLLDSGTIGRGRPMTIGFDTEGHAVEVSFKALFSAGVGGLQGSGKTWSAVNIIAQSVLSGARLAICDLHAGDEESLATRLEPLNSALLFDVADNPKSITTAIKNVDAILTRRKDGDKDRSLIVLAFDEYTSTLRRLGKDADAVGDVIANLTSEGRKYGIFCLLLAQNWGAGSTGGSEVRNTLASALIHRIRPAEARMLTGMTADDLPTDTLQLGPGEFYLLDTHGDLTKVAAPRITQADVVRCGRLLLGDGSESRFDLGRMPVRAPVPSITVTATENVPETYHTSTGPSTGHNASGSGILPSAEAAEVQRLFFAEKLSITEIVYRLRQVRGNQGAKYQQALAEVQDLLRQGMAGS